MKVMGHMWNPHTIHYGYDTLWMYPILREGYTMGYDYSVRYMDMGSQENATEVTTVLDWAQDRGELLVKEKEKVVVNVVT